MSSLHNGLSDDEFQNLNDFVNDTQSNDSTNEIRVIIGADLPEVLIPTYLLSPTGECPRTRVEIELIEVCGAIRDRVEWWNKIGNLEIVGEWKKEAINQGVNERTFQHALAEAYTFADQYSENVAKPAAAEGTFMRDGLPEGLQDRLVRDVQRLRHGFNPIGQCIRQDGIPETNQIVDVHPGSNGMVIDLVHPGLYAYEGGVSAITHGDGEVYSVKVPNALSMLVPIEGERYTILIPDGCTPGEEIYVDLSAERRYYPKVAPDWQDLLGTSEVEAEEKVLPPEPSFGRWQNRTSPDGLLWLPSEFELSADGKELSINSYINNLHPQQHASLYKGISDCFLAVVPLFEAVLSQLGTDGKVNPWPLRIPIPNDGEDGSWWSYPKGGYGFDGCPTTQDVDDEGYVDHELLGNAQDTWIRNHHADCGAVLSEPQIPDEFVEIPMPSSTFSLRGRSLQVITKIASIELTPSSPRFNGGTWHVEGLADERIVATACVYLESENVGETKLSFRTEIKPPKENYDLDWIGCGHTEPTRTRAEEGEWKIDAGDYEGANAIYGFEKGEEVSWQPSSPSLLIQPRGVSRTLSGRVLAWPNTLQHCVQPFELENKALPGRRTILCFFLVDPTKRIRSTATVPPQQREWLQLEARALLIHISPPLPFDIRSHIIGFVGGGNNAMPLSPGTITYEEAADRRLRLMRERKATEQNARVGEYSVASVTFCEH